MQKDILKLLNTLKDVPFEEWRARGVKLAAVSANAYGRVNSGLVQQARNKTVYFTRKHQAVQNEYGFAVPKAGGDSFFVLG